MVVMTLQELQERFGEDGMKELAWLDARQADLIDRLYKLTTIALNLKNLEVEGADDWFNNQTRGLKNLMDEADRNLAEFQNKRGEI